MSNDKRELDRTQPVALDDRDPGNSEIDDLVEPLEPDDNVFSLVNPDQGDLREATPVQEPVYGD